MAAMETRQEQVQQQPEQDGEDHPQQHHLSCRGAGQTRQTDKKKKASRSRAEVIRLTYKKRKECIKKKTMELAIKCDLKTCSIVCGPDGDVETWPENPNDIKAAIQLFKEAGGVIQEGSRDQEEDCSRKSNNSNNKEKKKIDRERVRNLLRDVDAKIESVNGRIELLRMINIYYEEKETLARKAPPVVPDDGQNNSTLFDIVNPGLRIMRRVPDEHGHDGCYAAGQNNSTLSDIVKQGMMMRMVYDDQGHEGYAAGKETSTLFDVVEEGMWREVHDHQNIVSYDHPLAASTPALAPPNLGFWENYNCPSNYQQPLLQTMTEPQLRSTTGTYTY